MEATPLTCASCLQVSVGTQPRSGVKPCREDGCFSYVLKHSLFKRLLRLFG